MEVQDLIITGGISKNLNVFSIINNESPIQIIPLNDWILSGLYVEPDTLFIGCSSGHFYKFEVN
jgi:hypothetical protein